MINDNSASQGQWSSRLGFILAATGAAVGLGNIWKFPYITGENGGGAFVLVYLLCVLLIGIPLMIAELSLGRRVGKSPVSAQAFRYGNKSIILGIFLGTTGTRRSFGSTIVLPGFDHSVAFFHTFSQRTCL